MVSFPASSEQDDSAYSPSRIPASPTARRQASGKAHPTPLDLSSPIASASALLALDSPPRTMDSSLSPRMLTPTRTIPSSAESQPGAAQLRTEARLASFSASSLTNGHGAPPSRPSVLGYNVSRRGSSLQQQQQAGGPSPTGAMSNTRFLLTVIPPSHLPHDPPHPKSNPNCSGYGPPEHFKRGTLIPLYPTLSSQLAAIAREYGLPSTGGLVVYLLSTTDPSSSVQASLPGAAGLEGGPRIGEEAWNLLWRRLFEEEDETLLLAESEDEDGYAPPVPPIPLSHRTYPSDGTSPADPTFPPTYSDAQQHQRAGQQGAASRRVASESDQALFSDGGEHEPERTSFSSEGDPEGSIYSGGGAAEQGVAEGSKARAAGGNRSSSRAGIGRGHPSGLPSPSASTRFASAPIPSTSRYSSYSQPNLRQVSRQSIRSNASRFGRSSYAPSGRATSFSNYSSQPLGGEPYGAAVVVGKVEFDIDRRKGGKSKWYEGWMESASQPASSGGTPSAVPSPRTREGDVAEGSAAGASTASTAERDGPSTQDAEPTSPRASAGSRNFSGGNLAPLSRGLRPLELSRSASPSGSMLEKAEDPMSPGSSVAASGYSNAAMAGHEDDEEAGSHARSPSGQSLAPSSRQRSRSSSLASSTQQHSLHPNDDEGYAPLVDSEVNYTQLEDDEASNPFESGRESRQSQPESEESDYDEQVEQVERGQQEQERREREDESEEGGSRTATLHQADPLGDVFPDDEATWRSLTEEPTTVVEKDMVETTGLGIVGARVLDLKSSAPLGVVERSPAEESAAEAGLPPPQDDVADVMTMLKSGQSEDRTDKINLASPIHLDSSPTAPSTTGVFESTNSFDDSHPPFDSTRASLDGAPSSFDDQSFEPAGGPVDLAARRRSSQRPRFGSGASARALNLVSIDVRPPSTVHSSPEYAPQRKQRQGWTNIPAVVDKSMSASTSLASLDNYGQPESQRDSTIGLMENLDDLERALADLSPTTSRKSPAITQEEPKLEAPSQNLVALAQPSTSLDEPSDGSREVSAEPESTVSRAASPPFPTPTSPVLAARPPFRHGASSSSSTTPPAVPAAGEPPARPPREDSLSVADSQPQANSDNEKTPETPSTSTFADSSFLDTTPLAGAFASPEQLPVPTAEAGAPGDASRTPRSSSLSRSDPQPPHQVALPPSPMPPQSESAWQEATSPAPPSAPFVSAPPPSSPRQFVSQRPAPPMPPIPTKEDEITFPEPPPRSPKSPKSPGGFKSLRSKQSWKKNKDKDIDVSKATPSQDAAAETESSKSPRTAFFAGKPFQKLGGMFVKKSGSESSPDPATSPVTSEPPASSLDQQAAEAAVDPISPPYDRLTSSPPLQAFVPSTADDSFDTDPPAGFDDEYKPPSIDYSTVRTSSYSGDFPPTASPDLLARPLPTPIVASQGLRPAASTDSFRSALSSLPTRNDSSSANSPAPQSIGNVTPTEDVFPTSYGADSSSYTPLPPLPYKSTTDSSSDAEYTVSSPRSEYGQPQTPVQGPLGYASSAPATPAAWQQRHFLEPGSRFGRGLAGASGGRQAAKQQLSADINQLLSQMNEIDFGGDDEDEEEVAEQKPSVAETSEEVPLPSEEKAVREQDEDEQDDEQEQEQDEEESFFDKRSKMQSLDVGASLGGLMMAASPPASPTIPPIPSAST